MKWRGENECEEIWLISENALWASNFFVTVEIWRISIIEISSVYPEKINRAHQYASHPQKPLNKIKMCLSIVFLMRPNIDASKQGKHLGKQQSTHSFEF